MTDLIVVSNRGPVSYAREGGARVERRGGGGLVTALRGLLSRHRVTWIASALGEEDRAVAEENGGEAFDDVSRDGAPYRLRLVAHDPAAFELFYHVVANPLLWFIHHYLWDLGSQPDVDVRAWHEGYERVNRGFADAVLAELERSPGAGVFFHDYHLYLAPAFVRAERAQVPLAHFVHVPWPQSDYWRVLPDPLRRAVHGGLLANDVVGFHTERWAGNFARSCADLVDARRDGDTLHHGGRSTLVAHHPISIDPSEFDELAQGADVAAAAGRLFEKRPEQVVLRVDRTDPSKNVVRGFRAFGELLARYPEHRGRVRMLALLDPSREAIPQYVEYRAAIEREAAAVNERFADGDWSPVDLRIRDDFPQTLAAYRDYDVLFVNPVSDGLNLVSKEAPLVNERSGVVVLSENAGSHEELGDWVVSVSPFDVVGQADALHAALTMDPGERGRRAAAIAAHVRAHDVSAWLEAQLRDLSRVTLRQ